MPEIKTFEQYLTNSEYFPNLDLIKTINSHEFPFLKNKFFSYNPAYLAATEFNRCLETYLNRTPGSSFDDLGYVNAMMIIKEDNIRKELEELAINTIVEMYDIPTNRVKMKAELEWISNVDEPDDQEKMEEVSEERKPALKIEIEKRRILNSIAHGAAIYQWDSASYLAKEQLDEFNPDLITIYNNYSSIINYLNWMNSAALLQAVPTTSFQSQIHNQGVNFSVVQGLCSTINKGKKGSIKAVGMCFPVLLHELSKGVISYLINKGIPDLPEAEKIYVLRKADKYQHEYWHYYFGPTLWQSILQTAQVESQLLPAIIMRMAQMEYEELAQFCIDITFFGDTIGKKQMEKLKKTIK